jgi:hypothetical protein
MTCHFFRGPNDYSVPIVASNYLTINGGFGAIAATIDDQLNSQPNSVIPGFSIDR